MEYSENLRLWLSEIKSEIRFWDRLFATQGKEGGDPQIFKFRTDPKCPFQIPNDLEKENSKILDVGSGPYSRLGYWYNNKKVDLTLVDPLAFAYKELEKKYGYKFAHSPQTGMVECLSITLPENEYDLVHMSNSLDHSFDPIEGIKQLLYVTKIGGKVILRHHNNVAEKENYQGLHQWNLTTEKGRFIVWNKNTKLDMNDYLNDFATIEFAAPSEERTLDSKWQFQKIVIRKNKRFECPPIYAGAILTSLCDHIMMKNIDEYKNSKLVFFKRLLNILNANRFILFR